MALRAAHLARSHVAKVRLEKIFSFYQCQTPFRRSAIEVNTDTVEQEADISPRTFSGLESKQGHWQSSLGGAGELVQRYLNRRF